MAIIYRNIKNQKIYRVIDTLIIDATNKNDGNEFMVLYKNERGNKFVRPRTEFYKKFEKTNLTKL